MTAIATQITEQLVQDEPTKQASKPAQRPKHSTPSMAIVTLVALLGSTCLAFVQTQSWASGCRPQASAKTTQVH